MKTWFIDNAASGLLIALLTFFLGRYTSYRTDCRAGMKELNEQFYRPFINLYQYTRHAYALYFVDFPLETQKELERLLLDHRIHMSLFLRYQIIEFDKIFSGIMKDIEANEMLAEEEKQYVEKRFNSIYNYVENEYKKNCRKLYCTWLQRVGYWLLERKLIFKIVELIIEKQISEIDK